MVQQNKQNSAYILISLIALVSFNCTNTPIPKPRGYFRIDIPDHHTYQKFDDKKFPYHFEYSKYARIENDHTDKTYWINIHYPNFNGKIHLTYQNLEGKLLEYLEESRNLTYKHTIKADAINEDLYIDKKNKKYGIIYTVEGNVASNTQFILSDSIKNFIRGALYFDSSPQADSLAPVIKFIQKDISHLIKTFKWHQQK